MIGRAKVKGPIDVSLTIRVTQEDGPVTAVARKTNPSFGESFPKGSEASFKESKGYAEKVTIGTVTGFQFTMGSHGSNEQDTFVPMKGKTLLVKCSYAGDYLSPTMSEADQLKACERVVSTLKL